MTTVDPRHQKRHREKRRDCWLSRLFAFQIESLWTTFQSRFTQALHVAHRRHAEESLVFAVEVRGVLVSDAVARARRIEVFAHKEKAAGFLDMIEVSAVGRAGTPDEVGTVRALLMGPDGGFITGSDFLIDGGVTAAYWYGELAPK